MNKEILEKVASFNKRALEEIESLEAQVAALRKEAELALEYKSDKLEQAVKKAADALYESDFLSSKFEVRDFIKKASNDPSQLTKVIEKICAYKDVANIGTPSTVTCKQASGEDEFDPIYSRTFGRQSASFNLLDD